MTASILTLVLATATPVLAQTRPLHSHSAIAAAIDGDQRGRDKAEREDEQREREADLYDEGMDALDDSRWDRAVARFSRVIELRGARTDASMYWKAYAQNKLGQRAEALASIAELLKSYPTSKYAGQAKVLDVEVRRDAGQPARPDAQADEELRLMALQALQHQDPEQAIPMLEKFLQGNHSLKMKERALFVLAQSSSPRARQVMAAVARGGSTPDLQRKAIQYLGVHGSRENRQLLEEIYSGTEDPDVKRRILHAFMISGERQKVYNAATREGSAEVRAEAIQLLGVMGAQDELSQLYQKETSRELKKKMLQAMFVGGNSARLIELAKSEPDPELRRTAVRNLGLMGSSRTGAALSEIYATEKDLQIRNSVLEGFFIQNNPEALVAIARKETDPEMKKRIVQKLSLMRSKAALDYLMELLNK